MILSQSLKYKFLVVIAFTFITLIWYYQRTNEANYNKYKCKTKEIALNGVVKKINSKSNYMQVLLDNMNSWVSLNIATVEYNKGFPQNHSYDVGDSIIKKTNSKKFIVKRDTCIAIYVLSCDE